MMKTAREMFGLVELETRGEWTKVDDQNGRFWVITVCLDEEIEEPSAAEWEEYGNSRIYSTWCRGAGATEDEPEETGVTPEPGAWYCHRDCDTIYCCTDGSLWIVASQDWTGDRKPEQLAALPDGAEEVPCTLVDDAVVQIADEIEAERGHCADCDGPCKGHEVQQ